MRSRFSAFAVGNVDYLLHSWSVTTRPETLELTPEVRWYRLDIVDTVAGGPLDDTGIVEFAAYYRDADSSGVQEERSSFAREDGRWVYVDAVGDGPQSKPGRR